MPSLFSHPTVFKSILLASFPRLLTSRKPVIRGLSVSEPELSISVTKQIDNSFQWSVLLSTIALFFCGVGTPVISGFLANNLCTAIRTFNILNKGLNDIICKKI